MKRGEINKLAVERLEEIKKIQYAALHRDGDDGTRDARLDSISETQEKIDYIKGLRE